MHPASHIALIAFSALFIAMLVPQVFTLAHRPLPTSAVVPGVLIALLEALTVAVLVGVGTYLGARWAAPHQRTVRLARVLGALYLVIGIALTLPVKTHAVVVDMPRGSGSVLAVSALVVSIGAAVVVVAISLALARGLAPICGGKVNRDV